MSHTMSPTGEQVLSIPPAEWDPLLSTTRLIVEDLAQADLRGIWARWRLGHHLVSWCDAQESRKAWYGKGLIEKIGAGVQLHPKVIYTCCSVARQFPTEQEFAAFLDAVQARRASITWDVVRQKSLPPLAEDPEQVGGVVNQIDNLLGVAEAAISQLERFCENGVPEAQRQELAGGILGMTETMTGLAHGLGMEPADVLPTPIPPATNPEQWSPSQVERFQSWIRAQPCACCGRQDDTIQAAHFPHSKGAGGQEWSVIPLCAEHHGQFHAEGVKTWWDAWKYQVLMWYAITIANQRGGA